MDGYDGNTDSHASWQCYCDWRHLGVVIERAVAEGLREFGLSLAEMRVSAIAERTARLSDAVQ